MVQTNEIKAQMRRVGVTQKTLAERLKINPSTLNRKINDKEGKKITVAEANAIAETLQFPQNSLYTIFFAPKLAETQES